MRTALRGPTLPVETCARRLAPLPDPGAAVDCSISWHGPAGLPPDRPGSEAAVQALCGLMQVHGRDQGRPRRLGLDVASTAAGVLAAQGVVAAQIARSRGRSVSAVETSVLQAGLLLVSHYVAIATASGELPSVPAGPDPGPPFRSADGHWFEIETLDPEAWRSFWSTIGAAGADLGAAWTVFRLRYNRGACTLPLGLHQATAGHTLAAVAEVADACGVSLCRVRSYAEVLVEPGWWEGHPTLQPLPAGTSGAPPTEARWEAPGTLPSSDDLPLSGLRVVEATNRVQGPLAGQLLRMLGADTVLVEPPGGDVARMGLPQAGDTGAFFLCFNRGKESVELDLGTPAGRASLLDLAAGADVFLHNWRPGKAAEWELDFEDLARHNPRLVYAGASGWGDLPQPSHLIGTDFMVQAYAALGHGVNPDREPPFPTRALITDYMGALVGCEGILAGLYHRERTGRGCQVATSLLAAAMTLQAPVLEALAAGREKGRRLGRPVWSCLDRPLETAEGFLVVSVDDDASFDRLCRISGVDAEGRPRSATEQLVVDRMRGRAASEWEELLVEARLPCSVACTDLAALPSDPRLSPLFEPLAGSSQVPAAPWRFTT